ncbi:hypothetical protein V6N12_015088 [Hibiscus sabdariffa]|uniref:Uncharacterized protein n=1 Tax=Hibiscus sabdariffa TaxID=183260 RepID=A0ABR2DM52_9ROSI
MLRACIAVEDFVYGKQIHGQIFKYNLQSDEFIGSALIELYSLMGSTDGLWRSSNCKIGSLSACSYGGLVEEDLEYVNVLSALVYKDTVTGKRAAMKVIELEPQESASYVPHNIYAEAVAEPLAASIRELMQQRGVKKVAVAKGLVVGLLRLIAVAKGLVVGLLPRNSLASVMNLEQDCSYWK